MTPTENSPVILLTAAKRTLRQFRLFSHVYTNIIASTNRNSTGAICLHAGSVAVGSFLVAVVQLLRAILAYLDGNRKTHKEELFN